MKVDFYNTRPTPSKRPEFAWNRSTSNHGPPQHSYGLGPARCGLTPNSFAGHAHCAEPQPGSHGDHFRSESHRLSWSALSLLLCGCVFLHALFPFGHSVAHMGYGRSEAILNLRMSTLPSTSVAESARKLRRTLFSKCLFRCSCDW